MDAEIAERVRARRRALGLSEREVAHAIGATSRQVQKYEVGQERIPSAVLMRLGEALKCDPASLLPRTEPAPHRERPLSKAVVAEQLLDAFNGIKGARERQVILELRGGSPGKARRRGRWVQDAGQS